MIMQFSLQCSKKINFCEKFLENNKTRRVFKYVPQLIGILKSLVSLLSCLYKTVEKWHWANSNKWRRNKENFIEVVGYLVGWWSFYVFTRHLLSKLHNPHWIARFCANLCIFTVNEMKQKKPIKWWLKCRAKKRTSSLEKFGRFRKSSVACFSQKNSCMQKFPAVIFTWCNYLTGKPKKCIKNIEEISPTLP